MSKIDKRITSQDLKIQKDLKDQKDPKHPEKRFTVNHLDEYCRKQIVSARVKDFKYCGPFSLKRLKDYKSFGTI